MKKYKIVAGYNSMMYEPVEFRIETDDEDYLNEIIADYKTKLYDNADWSDVAYENDMDTDEFEDLSEYEQDEYLDEYIYADWEEFDGTDGEWNSLDEWTGEYLLP